MREIMFHGAPALGFESPAIPRRRIWLWHATLLVAWLALHVQSGVEALADPPATIASRLLAAYPDHLERVEGNALVWRDGTRMPIDDGHGSKAFEEWLSSPDIEDTLALAYPAFAPATPPATNFDPGRARNAAFFDKMYGDCSKDEVKSGLRKVAWLPSRSRQSITVTSVNGVADRLAAISGELDRLPPRFDVFLKPAAGGYVCRAIAGTGRGSAHGYGIAVDVALKRTHYWRWSNAGGGGIAYRNDIPLEIVSIFEKHGFIWGGRWYHYDTMHFEYRPELIPR